jgi:hypothetical protein
MNLNSDFAFSQVSESIQKPIRKTGWGSWFPTLSPDHPADEDLSVGTPARRKDGARKDWGGLKVERFWFLDRS